MKLCRLPVKAKSMTFESFEVTPELQDAYDVALRFAEGDETLKWLTILAPVDRGKTHLAIAICHRWLERGHTARYVLVPLLLDQLRQGYNDEKARQQSSSWEQLPYERQMRFLMDVELLVLDDLGSQVPTPWAIEKLMLIIDHRDVNDLPLIVTCNKPLDNLPGDDEGRIGSRLMRFKSGKVIVIDAPEHRIAR